MKEDVHYPVLHAKRFICPFCGIYFEQNWQTLFTSIDFYIYLSTCCNCKHYLLWKNEYVIDPPISMVEVIHHMTPDSVKRYYELAQIAITYDSTVAYAYINWAILSLLKYMGATYDSVTDAIEEWKRRGIGSYALWNDIEKLNLLRYSYDGIVIDLEKQNVDEVKKGFMLFNQIVEECIADPINLVDFFANIKESESSPHIDPNFFERD